LHFDYKMKEIAVWMIVQSNNSKHIDNFNIINEKIHLHFFPAIQSSEHYQLFSDFAIHKNYFHIHCINKFDNERHKLGENLSQLLLFNEILEKSKHDWNLVLDGSVLLNIDLFLQDYESILKIADENNSKYVQLYMQPKFFDVNKKHKYEDNELYDLTIQTDNKVFFIHKSGISKLIESYPLQNNVNDHFGEMIPIWKSLYWKNKCFHIM